MKSGCKTKNNEKQMGTYSIQSYEDGYNTRLCWPHLLQTNQMVTISKTRPQYAQTSAGHPLESQSARQVIYHYQSIAQSVENGKIGMG
jgi:hypothetical protein